MSKGNRSLPEIPSGSMADIAFLLLIFFLVTTTIDTDRGLRIMLPPVPDGPPPIVQQQQRNVQVVLVNSRDQLLVDGQRTQIENLREVTKEFIDNPHNRSDLAESPDKAIVSLRADRGTSYNMYVQVQNELKGAYNELRDRESQSRFGRKYGELNLEQRQLIRSIYPQRISEAEPEEIQLD